VLTLALLVVAAGASWAGDRDHEDGFFLRLSGGGGTGNSELSSGGETLKLSGTTADLNFAIGAIVTPNLALHGTIFGWLISDPTVEMNGDSGTATGTDLDLSAYGAGVTYYLMPANVYFSGSLGFGSLSTSGVVSGNTDAGPVLDLTIGKEWWVSNGWALGIAGGFSYHSLPEPGVDDNWSGTSFALRFTATMN
jgi:hypothetical protein